MEELFQNMPQLLQYLVPGYLCILIFKSLTSRKIGTNITILMGCVISFVTIGILQLVSVRITPLTEFWVLCIVACCLDAIVGIIAAYLFRHQRFKQVFVKCFAVTPDGSAISNVVDWENGSNVKVYLHDTDYYLLGHLFSLENNGANSWMCLHSPMKCHLDGTTFYSQADNDDAYLSLPLTSVLYMEIIN